MPKHDEPIPAVYQVTYDQMNYFKRELSEYRRKMFEEFMLRRSPLTYDQVANTLIKVNQCLSRVFFPKVAVEFKVTPHKQYIVACRFCTSWSEKRAACIYNPDRANPNGKCPSFNRKGKM